MPVQVQDKGDYELFETTHGHRILVLNGKRWFAWVEGDQGEILVHSDSDHEKDHTIQQGKFFVVDFEDDPTYKDIPHLFLQQGDHYQELMVPNGLPTEQDYQKKLVMTDETLPRDELEGYLEHPDPAGSGESRMDRPGGGSMANVTHHLKGVDFPASRQEVLRHARERAAPEAVIEQLEKLEQRKYSSMAEVTSAIGEEKNGSAERSPIENYDELTVEEVRDRLDELGREQIEQLRTYEQEHKQRKTLLEELDHRLERSRSA